MNSTSTTRMEKCVTGWCVRVCRFVLNSYCACRVPFCSLLLSIEKEKKTTTTVSLPESLSRLQGQVFTDICISVSWNHRWAVSFVSRCLHTGSSVLFIQHTFFIFPTWTWTVLSKRWKNTVSLIFTTAHFTENIKCVFNLRSCCLMRWKRATDNTALNGFSMKLSNNTPCCIAVAPLTLVRRASIVSTAAEWTCCVETVCRWPIRSDMQLALFHLKTVGQEAVVLRSLNEEFFSPQWQQHRHWRLLDLLHVSMATSTTSHANQLY